MATERLSHNTHTHTKKRYKKKQFQYARMKYSI